MATERLAPDSLLVQTGLTGAVTAIDEDPDSPDGSWLTTSNNTTTVCRVSFPTPTGEPTVGAGLQEFRALVRKTNHSTDPTATIEVYENGSLVTTLVSSQTISSTTGVVLSGTWNASSLSTSNGSQVELRVSGTPGGGNPNNRASVEVGAVEWNVTYTAAQTHDVSGADGSDAGDSSSTVVAKTATSTDGAEAGDSATMFLSKDVAGADGAEASDDANALFTYDAQGADGTEASDAATVQMSAGVQATDGAEASDSASVTVDEPTAPGHSTLTLIYS